MNFSDSHQKTTKLFAKPLSALIAMTAGALICATSSKSQAKTTYVLPESIAPDTQSVETRVQKVKTQCLSTVGKNPKTGEIQTFSWGNWRNGDDRRRGCWRHDDRDRRRGCWRNWNNWHNYRQRPRAWLNL